MMYRYFLFAVFIFSCASAQSTAQQIDVQHYSFAINLTDANDTLKGQASVAVKFLKDVDTFQLNLVKVNSKGKGMLVSAITENGKSIAFAQDSDVVNINAVAKKNSLHSFIITYQGIPADGLIISVNKFGRRTFFG